MVWLGYLGVWAELPHSQGGLLRKAGAVHRGRFSKAVSVGEKGGLRFPRWQDLLLPKALGEDLNFVFHWICKSVGGMLKPVLLEVLE